MKSRFTNWLIVAYLTLIVSNFGYHWFTGSWLPKWFDYSWFAYLTTGSWLVLAGLMPSIVSWKKCSEALAFVPTSSYYWVLPCLTGRWFMTGGWFFTSFGVSLKLPSSPTTARPRHRRRPRHSHGGRSIHDATQAPSRCGGSGRPMVENHKWRWMHVWYEGMISKQQ